MTGDVLAGAEQLVAHFAEIDGSVAVFSHSHLGRVFAVRWLGLAVEHAVCFMLDTASVSILGFDREHGKPRSLMLWNSTLTNSLPLQSLQDKRSPSAMKQHALECWENVPTYPREVDA